MSLAQGPRAKLDPSQVEWGGLGQQGKATLEPATTVTSAGAAPLVREA